MKKYVNGQYVEMTAYEIAEMEKMREEVEVTPQMPTVTERILALEKELAELKEALK